MSMCNVPKSTSILPEPDYGAAITAFTESLVGHGYRPAAISRYVGGASHFLYWLDSQRRRIADIDERTVCRFLDRHLDSCRCPKLRGHGERGAGVRQALGLFLVVLRDQSWIAPIASPRSGTLKAEMVEFEHHMREVCGLAAATRVVYLQIVRGLLSAIFGARTFAFTRLTARDVRRGIERYCSHWQPTSRRAVGVSLRCYLRFKAIHGASIESLMAAIPPVARWRSEDLPESLTTKEVQRFLAAFDRTVQKDCVTMRWHVA